MRAISIAGSGGAVRARGLRRKRFCGRPDGHRRRFFQGGASRPWSGGRMATGMCTLIRKKPPTIPALWPGLRPIRPDGFPDQGPLLSLRNPKRLTLLPLDYGWGWGDGRPGGADAVSFMLLDPKGNGYLLRSPTVPRRRGPCSGGKVASGLPVRPGRPGRQRRLTPRTPSVRDGGGLSRLSIVRESDGAWSITGKDWNKGGRRDGEVHRPPPPIRSANWSCWARRTSMNRSSIRSF